MLNLLIDRQHIVMMADNSERIMLGLQKIEKLYPFFSYNNIIYKPSLIVSLNERQEK